MSPNTSTALFTFPKDLGALQIKLLRAILCSATRGNLTRCCQFDDGTRQLAEITYKDALEKHGCLEMEDLQFEAVSLTWDQASQNSFTFTCHLTNTIGIRVSWDPFNPDWIASAAAQVMIDTQQQIRIQLTVAYFCSWLSRGYTAKTDPGGVYHARLNPPSQEREWHEILLPRSKRGGQ